MYKRVFRPKGSRVYRLRYKLSNGPKIYDVPLKTHVKEVAETKARLLIEEEERALVGLAEPKSIRETARKPLVELIEEFVSYLRGRGKNKDHVRHTNDRLLKLCKECGWRMIGDVTPMRFMRWQGDHAELSAKTRNEYLAHAAALFNWLIRLGRANSNPIKGAIKLPKAATFQRRALTFEEFCRLMLGTPAHRRLAYFAACCTGLRRGEMKQLLWTDLVLDEPDARIVLRPETTKNKKGGEVPLLPPLAEFLRQTKAKGVAFNGRVFPRGLPSVTTLEKDLGGCDIKVTDGRGHRVDFHALRHTFVSLLAHVEASEMARIALARHSSWKQTAAYTDPKSVPVVSAMAKLAAALPSSIASLNFGKTWQKQGNIVQMDTPETGGNIIPIASESATLAKAIPSWESDALVPKGGLEPPCG